MACRRIRETQAFRGAVARLAGDFRGARFLGETLSEGAAAEGAGATASGGIVAAVALAT